MITFQRELLMPLREECQAIIHRHWEAIALNKDTVPLEPIWEYYEAMEKAEQIYLFTARDDGRLIGYANFIRVRCLHYGSLMGAECDVFWVDPDVRGPRVGFRLMKFAEQGLRESGVNKVVNKSKIAHPLDRFFETLGYTAFETVWARNL